MWRKEQHFTTTYTRLEKTHLPNNHCTDGPFFGKRPSQSDYTNGLIDCCEGHTMYKGHEFDIFGRVIVTQKKGFKSSLCNNNPPSIGPVIDNATLIPHLSAAKSRKREAQGSLDVQYGNKQCRTITSYASDMNTKDSSVLQTSTVDIVPINDDNDCFSTQHVIYS